MSTKVEVSSRGCLFRAAFLVGALFALLGLALGVRSLSLSVGTLRTEGTVVAMVKQEPDAEPALQFKLNRQRPSYLPTIRYEVDGQAFTCQGLVGVPQDYYAVGSRVSVLYRAADPATAYLNSRMDRFIFPFAFFAFGAVVMTLVGVVGRPWKAIPKSSNGSPMA